MRSVYIAGTKGACGVQYGYNTACNKSWGHLSAKVGKAAGTRSLARCLEARRGVGARWPRGGVRGRHPHSPPAIEPVGWPKSWLLGAMLLADTCLLSLLLAVSMGPRSP